MKVLILTTAALLALASSSSFAEEPAGGPTRESYRDAVEPICKANIEASGKILEGVTKEVREGKLKLAGSRFAKASRALRGTWRQLSAVAQPSVDQTRLANWLGYIAQESDLLQATAKKLKAGQRFAAEGMAVRLTYTIAAANREVTAFEFDYCRAKASQFT